MVKIIGQREFIILGINPCLWSMRILNRRFRGWFETGRIRGLGNNAAIASSNARGRLRTFTPDEGRSRLDGPVSRAQTAGSTRFSRNKGRGSRERRCWKIDVAGSFNTRGIGQWPRICQTKIVSSQARGWNGTDEFCGERYSWIW